MSQKCLLFTRSRRSPTENWTPHRHPEGALYFMQKKNRVLTDEYLYDDATLTKVNACTKKCVGPADDIDIVLDLIEDQFETIKCGYYLMDVFKFSQLSSWKRVPGITSASHTSSILEHAYWQHCDLFPAARLPSAALVSELRDTIIYSAMDALTSPTTTIPFSVDDLLKMLTLTNDMTSGGPRTQSSGVEIDQGSSSALALERVNHLHGEYVARLDRRKSVYGASPKCRYWMVLSSPLLFNAPNGHLQNLRAIFMDELVSQLSWKRLMEKVLSEWQDMTLYGTLILNANVGILAVPGSANTPIAQVASYMSICFGLASIILGLLLSRKYRPDAADAVTAGPAFSFKKQCLQALEARASLFSLPYVFIIWGVIAFLLTSTRGTSAIVLATAAALFVAILSSIFPTYGWSLMRMIRTAVGPSMRQSLSPSRRHGWRQKIDFRQFWRVRPRTAEHMV
ncbi:hypothetical protein B0H11DRAFT_1994306 [Mycena galericulata]|nr:hypothetical protein B0H11DRAFT_1994306 [Mycena galericulata]